jgi:translation initiation factor 1 (eIF-1/SUI1)
MKRIPYIEIPQAALRLIRPRHREIMRRKICGQINREIAAEMCLSEHTVSIICAAPLFVIELRKMEKEVRAKAIEKASDISERIIKLQGPALSVLENIIQSKEATERLKRDAANDILGLGGIKKGKQNEDGMSDFAQFISDAYIEAKATALSRLNQDSEMPGDRALIATVDIEATDITEAIDGTSGQALSVEDAEDVALTSFNIQLPPEEITADTPPPSYVVRDENGTIIPNATIPKENAAKNAITLDGFITGSIASVTATDEAAQAVADMEIQTGIILSDTVREQLFRLIRRQGVAALKDVKRMLMEQIQSPTSTSTSTSNDVRDTPSQTQTVRDTPSQTQTVPV